MKISGLSTRLIVVFLLGIQTILIAYSATTHSPTQLEPAILSSGVSHYQLNNFCLYRVNPPFVRMVAALPIMAIGHKSDWQHFSTSPGARSEFAVGSDFVRVNGPDTVLLIIYARFMCIPFSLIGSFFAYRWAKEMYGGCAGIFTLAFYTFEPNLLAHGELITPDSACVAFGIMSNYFFWRWIKKPGFFTSVLSGITLGLAEISKMTWLILFVVWPTLWIACRFRFLSKKKHFASHQLAAETSQLILIFLISLYIINSSYGFDGVGIKLKEYSFASKTLTGNLIPGRPGNRFENTWCGELPVPLPKQYLIGLDLQKKDLEEYKPLSYLLGEWRQGGWWNYYIYGSLFKLPCGILFFFCLVFSRKIVGKFKNPAIQYEVVLLVPMIFLFIVVSSQTEFSIHYRYVLPSIGMLMIFLGQSAILLIRDGVVGKAVAIGFIVYTVSSSIISYPHHISYFNDAVGGAMNGHQYLLGSNLDWGQDLLRCVESSGGADIQRVGPYVSGGYSWDSLLGVSDELRRSGAAELSRRVRVIDIGTYCRSLSEEKLLFPGIDSAERCGYTLFVFE